MTYKHRFVGGDFIDLPICKVLCVGRNYAAHAKELGNEVPKAPIFFIKSKNTLVPFVGEFQLPDTQWGACHFETECAVLIAKPLKCAGVAEVERSIAGFGLALDLTLRDLQSQLKAQGHPWERAKSFDGACPLSPFVDKKYFPDQRAIRFTSQLNGAIVQQGMVKDMLWPILTLIQRMSEVFTLEPGDVVLTGTPAGVGPIMSGDHLTLLLQDKWCFESVAK